MDFSKDLNETGSDSAKTARPFPKKIDSSKTLGQGQSTRLNCSLDDMNQGIPSSLSSNGN